MSNARATTGADNTPSAVAAALAASMTPRAVARARRSQSCSSTMTLPRAWLKSDITPTTSAAMVTRPKSRGVSMRASTIVVSTVIALFAP